MSENQQSYIDALRVMIDYLKMSRTSNAAPLVILIIQTKNITSLDLIYVNIILTVAILSFSISSLFCVFYIIYVQLILAKEILHSGGETIKGGIIFQLVEKRSKRFIKLDENSFITIVGKTDGVYHSIVLIGWISAFSIVILSIWL